jgi:photosystem II stability/assembly factor-like uncharacterized protein
MNKFLSFAVILIIVCSFCNVSAQSNYPFDSTLFENTKFRNIGPFRGGRASGVCGDYKNKEVYYMAATGGGVWKTKDAGQNWKNISDGYFGGSIGAIEVSKNDPLLLYVGTGESTLRGNVSEGHGMWKSTDGGRTWKFIGLKDSRHIAKIIIHPKDNNIVYVAAVGHLFGPNKQRGIFKTTDGGQTWNKVLFVNENVGAADIAIDPTNPDILFASTWRVRRTHYDFSSGGHGSGLWKSTDGGESWKNITKSKGLPKDTLGIITIAIAPSNPDKMYSIIESKKGGLFVSEDAGKTWKKQNSESKIRQRSWYFSRMAVDPKDENELWVCNVRFHKSTDGGKKFTTIRTPHADHHGIWIDPEDGSRMAIADDGGVQISKNKGKSWSTYMNQPTSQFYRVSTDNHFPYRILGCQQDNSSMRIASRTYHGDINQQDWERSAGFESGHIVADPLNPEIVYGGNYGGYLSRYNHTTKESRTVSVWPVSPIGAGADVLKYRFQWNFPIFFSPHNSKRLYAAGNELFVTTDEGQSWKSISPDLTTNDKSKQKPSGGSITKDNSGVEYYCTIFAAAESPAQEGVIWCGSDDGLVHLTQNGGTTWDDVTPKRMPDWTMINCIEPSQNRAGTCFIVGTRYKLDDETPFIYKTTNYGRTWKNITNGIPNDHFVRAIRQDRSDPNILYCGTEKGLYISFNQGEDWNSFQLNLPTVPITDLALKDNSLIVATQGRSFWILDDLSFIRQAQKDAMANFKENVDVKLFTPKYAYRMRGWQNKNVRNAGMNHAPGVVFQYWLNDNFRDSSKVEIIIRDENGEIMKTITNKGKDKDKNFNPNKGMNQTTWNMTMKGVKKIDKMILWNGTVRGYKVPPGMYTATLKVGGVQQMVNVEIRKDKNYEATDKDYQEQFAFLKQIRNKFFETQETIKNIKSVKTQITQLKNIQGDAYPKDLDTLGEKIKKKLNKVESALYQNKAVSHQDVLNYPIKLNDKLGGLFRAANQETAPSQQVKDAYRELSQKIDEQLSNFMQILDSDVADYNRLVREKRIDFIQIKREKP